MDKYIKILLGIKDTRIELDNQAPEVMTTELKNGIRQQIWHLKLSYDNYCPHCACLMSKNGTKLVKHIASRAANVFNQLAIRKQKYLCPQCHLTALAEFSDIKPGDHIMTNVKQAAAMELSENVSQKHIAQAYNISPHTVMRQAQGLFTYNKTAFHYLPQHIAFDDFKSGNFAKNSGMSMILMDSATHRVLDIMQDRGDNNLRHYFEQYSYQARAAVKTITVDLFSPYRHMIHDLFPHAQIIADRFHVVTQVYRALNTIRIQTIKDYGASSRAYRQLKKYWKLLLKDETTLNYTDFRKRRNYRYAYLTDQEVIDRLLALSPELRSAYNFYQDVLYAVRHQDFNQLQKVVTTSNQDPRFQQLPEAMKKARRTLKHHLSEIQNSFIYKFSNGPVEGTNNKIKVIKRTAYGFRNFELFRLRILIAFKDSFYSQNYTKKATKFVKNSVA
ncbi:ISL3 family transposase [Weissella paramesenteroides]|uniref:ISL3 family transposase n=1 Tax=Weissella paramesenteroides TaxID=1249 RepID=UPI0038572216